MPSPPTRQRKARGKSAPQRPYHHGNLQQTLIETAVQLIEAGGLENITVREVARAAGVSPAAPFRHFANRTALLTAVAEEAMTRLTAEVERGLAQEAGSNPLLQFRAIGHAFLRWAIANPTHFQVISNRAVIDFETSSLRSRNDAIRARVTALLEQAQAQGLLRPGDVMRYQIGSRALVYGLARMYVDGQFPSWELDEEAALENSLAVFDQFIDSIASRS
ncbi:TetR/AcrR family transcriptional regulator [Dyella subtropica]|uniref:TetR/AcrR family transcriptional regulator n=1 Tax=Dyella subtropica TaxID=2992127 RepID=UPI002250EDE8|nr:TetR/AcrR family transcriptional regulator [Dyella subtropica]